MAGAERVFGQSRAAGWVPGGRDSVHRHDRDRDRRWGAGVMVDDLIAGLYALALLLLARRAGWL